MHNKSEVKTHFLHFKSLVELQFNEKIKAIQTDEGKEYTVLTDYLRTNGIIHRMSCPHTHQQQGSAERKHRHVTEVGLTLLASSGLPHSFWADAFVAGIFVTNRIPSSVLYYLSPFEKLFNKCSDYSIFRPFGCLCYPHLRPFNNHKMDFRSAKCIFIGYSTAHKGYKCMNSKGKIYIARHVVFDELIFPAKQAPFLDKTSPMDSLSESTFAPAIQVLSQSTRTRDQVIEGAMS
jgi:histone deacetylase 1/2